MPGVKDWLEKASNDLIASQKLSDDSRTLDCCVFHTHQCAEKAFKTFIIQTGQTLPKTHNLTVLLDFCGKINPSLTILKSECGTLNPYGQNSRYPSDNFYIDTQLAKEAVAIAEKILATIKKNIRL